MKFMITADNGYEDHKTSESAAIKAAKELVANGRRNVFIEFYRFSDGQWGYINPDGAGLTGKRWD